MLTLQMLQQLLIALEPVREPMHLHHPGHIQNLAPPVLPVKGLYGVGVASSPTEPYHPRMARMEMRVSLLDMPPIFTFVRAVATITSSSEDLSTSEMRNQLEDAMEQLAHSLNPVEDFPS